MNQNQKPKEMLVLNPPYELHFVGPFIVPRTTILKIKNPTNTAMLFKIKTTAPKRYCVRPNFGAIFPEETNHVEICLQPFNYDPNEKNKHKFMVQSMVAPDVNDTSDLAKLWKEAEQSGLLMDCKLRCVFDMPPDSGAANDKSVSTTSQVDAGKTNQSPPKPVEIAPEKEEVFNQDVVTMKELMEKEMTYLQKENSLLRKDNTNLKDQITKLLCNPPKGDPNSIYTPQFDKEIPMFYIAIAFAAAIFGLLLGKFLL